MARTTSLTGLTCDLVDLDDAPEFTGDLLGVVEYSDRVVPPGTGPGYPWMSMAMTTDDDTGFAEIWRGTGDITAGRRDGLAYAADDEFLFCCGQTGDVDDCLVPTEDAYVEALDLMRQLGYPRLVRMWNMVHGIVPNYTRFCDGRGAAFERCDVDTALMPAATGVGAHGGGVAFYFLASRSARLTHIENPRQIPAYRYPRRYGGTSRSFARATHARFPGADPRGQLFISGTASILGADTAHHGDLARQCVTTLDNIAALISGPNLAGHGIDADLTLADVDQAKVYVKPGADVAVVRRICAQAFGDRTRIGYANVDMCRDDLLVEIEGVVANV